MNEKDMNLKNRLQSKTEIIQGGKKWARGVFFIRRIKPTIFPKPPHSPFPISLAICLFIL